MTKRKGGDIDDKVVEMEEQKEGRSGRRRKDIRRRKEIKREKEEGEEEKTRKRRGGEVENVRAASAGTLTRGDRETSTCSKSDWIENDSKFGSSGANKKCSLAAAIPAKEYKERGKGRRKRK